MRILVFFDLPVKTKSEKRDYGQFRKFLIGDGFGMLQFSVYVRITRNHDDAQKHLKRLSLNLPLKGSVRVMLVTEKQYSSMAVMVGQKTSFERRLGEQELLFL